MRIFPEIWPSTTCPFSSLTRNVALGEILENLALHLDDVVLGHRSRVQLVLKLAFLSKLSYCWLIT